MSRTITIIDDLPGTRTCEPIQFTVPEALPEQVWVAETDDGDEVLCQRLAEQPTAGTTAFIATPTFSGYLELTLDRPADASTDGIRELAPREDDAFVRLDTGWFDLELCTGTAQGTGASKWGLRHFASVAEGVDLLPSGNNAIGGFYGPFFTPENGLINPPEHTTVEVEVVERGPVLHHYRLHGTVPDGLRPELRGKQFAIDFRFTLGTPWFERRYHVDPFQTIVNGRSVTNKITVGDEFEGGRGELVFDRFAASGGTRYRAGDPYAEELAVMVQKTIEERPGDSAKLDEFVAQLSGDISEAHWDLYWRLFCSWEGALTDEEISARLQLVREAAHVRADLPERGWILADTPVDVATAPDQTIFPGPAQKTIEYSTEHDRAMIWWTSQASGAFQIVQRRQSGWVNWGSNGENECPELPVGATIRTAYGPFTDQWLAIADQLENAPRVAMA